MKYRLKGIKQNVLQKEKKTQKNNESNIEREGRKSKNGPKYQSEFQQFTRKKKETI